MTTSVVSTIVQNYTVAAQATAYTGIAVGFVLFGTGIFTAYLSGKDPMRYPVRRAITTAVAGMMLISAGLVSGLIMTSVTGSSKWNQMVGHMHSALAIDPEALTQAAGTHTFLTNFIPNDTIVAILGFVYFVGLLNFLRGLYLLKNIGEQNPNHQSGAFRALTHIGGGLVAMHITLFGPFIMTLLGIR